MLRASIIFFAIALVAYILGATGLAGLSMEMGKIIIFVFLVLAAISFVGSLFTGRKGNI